MISLNPSHTDRFFHKTQEMVAVLGSQGSIRKVNPSWSTKLGWTKGQLLSRSIFDFVHPDDRTDTVTSFHCASLHGAACFTHRFRCRSGRYSWLSWSLIAIGDGLHAIVRDVSAEKNKEIFFDDMQNAARIGSWRWNIDEPYFLWSEQAYHIHALPLQTPVDEEKLLELYPMEYRSVLKASLDECLEHGTSFDLELPSLCVTGNKPWVRVIGHAQRDQQGKIQSLYGVFQEITAQTERNLESEAYSRRLKNILATTQNIIWEVSYPDRNFVYLTEPQLENLYGCPAREFLKDPSMWWKMVHPEDQALALAKDRTMLESKSPGEVTYRIIRPDGEIRWVKDRSIPLHDHLGRIIGLQGIASDITSEKEREAYLTRFREIVELAQEGIWEIDAEGQTLYVNPRMAEMLEMGSEEMLRTSLFDFIDLDQKEEARRILNECPTLGTIRELKFRTGSGNILWTSMGFRRRLDSAGRMTSAVVMITDISAVKRREQELIEINGLLNVERGNLKAFIANMPTAAAMFDREMRYISHSDQWLVDYKRPESSLVGLSHYDVFPDAPEKWRELHQRTLAGENFSAERELIVYRGSRQWLRWALRPWCQGDEIRGIIIMTQDVTAVVEAEERLRQDKEIFEAIAQNIPVMLSMGRSALETDWVNTYFEKLLGWKLSEMKGQDMVRACYEDPEQQERAKAMIGEEHRHWKDFLTRTKAGNLVHTSWATIQLSTGQVLGIGLDMTERVKDRQRIEQSEAEIRSLIESSPDHILRIDPSFRILYINHPSGVYSGEVIGRSAFDFVPTESVSFVQRMFSMAVETASPISFELDMSPTSAGVVRYSHRLIPLVTPGGELRELMMISQDITLQHQASEKIRTLASLIEASQDIYFVFDAQGQPIYFNNAARMKLGWDESIASIDELLPPEVALELKREVLPFIMETEQQWEGETEIIDKRHQARVPVWQRIFCLKDDSGKNPYYAMVAADLRQQKADRMRLIQASKMATLGEMAGGVAHEINNPLAVIHAAVLKLKRELEKHGVDLPEVQRAIKITEETTLRIAHIVKGLRAYARDDSQETMTTVTIQEVVNDTLGFCAERIRNHGIQLIVDPIPPTLKVDCRPVQIAQILLNLLSNSFDAVEPLREKWIRLSVQEHSCSVEISVTDSGLGIDSALLDKIMNPFFTTKPVGKGTGLGLSIARGIAQSHGGVLSYDPGSEHTRFVLQLPRRAGEGQPMVL